MHGWIVHNKTIKMQWKKNIFFKQGNIYHSIINEWGLYDLILDSNIIDSIALTPSDEEKINF